MTGVVVQFRLDGVQQVKKELQDVAVELKRTATAANDSSAGGWNTLTRNLETTSTALTSLGASLTGMGTKLTLGISAPMVAAGAALFKFAADANEAEGKFNLLMGNMAEEARAFSVKLREELGLNEFEVRQQVSSFFQMSEAMGISRDAGLDMAKGLTVLTADMVSLFNLEPDAAFDKLHQAMLGNSRGLKELNIIVDENTIKQTAMTHGLMKQGDEMTEQQKVLARYLTILDQTQKVQGDLARNLDSPTNQLRKMTNEVEQAAISLGQALMPRFQELIADILKPLTGLLVNLVNGFKGLSPEMQRLAVGAAITVAAIGPLLIAFGSMLKVVGLLMGASGLAGLFKLLGNTALISAIVGFGVAFGSLAVAVVGVGSAFLLAFASARSVMNWFGGMSWKGAVTGAEQDMNHLADSVIGKFTNMASGVSKAFTGMFKAPDGQDPMAKVAADAAKTSDTLKGLFADSAKSAEQSFGDIVSSSDKATLEQMQNLEKLRRARERADDAHRQFANSSAELQQAIAADQLRQIETVAEYDIDAQYRMLQAELAHFDALGEEGSGAADLIITRMRDLEVQMRDRTFGGGLLAAIGEMNMAMTDMGAVARDVVGVAFTGLRDVVSNFIQTGKISFGDFVDSMKRYLADFLASQIVGKFLTFLAGLAGITVSGGASAGGGVSIGGSGGGVNIGVGGGTGGGGIGTTIGKIPGLSGVGTFIQGGQNTLATSVGNLLLKAGVSPEFASNVVGNIANAGLANVGAGMAGSFAAGLLGAEGLDASIGGTIGGLIGTAFGPVGTFVGSFLGSMIGDLFGGLLDNPSYPFARMQVLMDKSGNITFPSQTSLDKGSKLFPQLEALGIAQMQSIAGTLADLGLPMQQVSFPIGYDAGRSGSMLGEGFFVGPPGNFENGAMFSKLSPEGAYAKGVELGLGRIPAAVARLAEQGVDIPSYETGGSPVFTSPTLIRVGERPEQVSVRHLGAGATTGGMVLQINGPAMFDEISVDKWARVMEQALAKRGIRGF